MEMDESLSEKYNLSYIVQYPNNNTQTKQTK